MCEREEAEEVSLKFLEENIASMKLQAKSNRGTIGKNVSCKRESMAGSPDGTPAKPSPVKKRRFQMFRKEDREKCPFVTVDEKGDICVNPLKFAVLL